MFFLACLNGKVLSTVEEPKLSKSPISNSKNRLGPHLPSPCDLPEKTKETVSSSEPLSKLALNNVITDADGHSLEQEGSIELSPANSFRTNDLDVPADSFPKEMASETCRLSRRSTFLGSPSQSSKESPFFKALDCVLDTLNPQKDDGRNRGEHPHQYGHENNNFGSSYSNNAPYSTNALRNGCHSFSFKRTLTDTSCTSRTPKYVVSSLSTTAASSPFISQSILSPERDVRSAINRCSGYRTKDSRVHNDEALLLSNDNVDKRPQKTVVANSNSCVQTTSPLSQSKGISPVTKVGVDSASNPSFTNALSSKARIEDHKSFVLHSSRNHVSIQTPDHLVNGHNTNNSISYIKNVLGSSSSCNESISISTNADTRNYVNVIAKNPNGLSYQSNSNRDNICIATNNDEDLNSPFHLFLTSTATNSLQESERITLTNLVEEELSSNVSQTNRCCNTCNGRVNSSHSFEARGPNSGPIPLMSSNLIHPLTFGSPPSLSPHSALSPLSRISPLHYTSSAPLSSNGSFGASFRAASPISTFSRIALGGGGEGRGGLTPSPPCSVLKSNSISNPNACIGEIGPRMRSESLGRKESNYFKINSNEQGITNQNNAPRNQDPQHPNHNPNNHNHSLPRTESPFAKSIDVLLSTASIHDAYPHNARNKSHSFRRSNSPAASQYLGPFKGSLSLSYGTREESIDLDLIPGFSDSEFDEQVSVRAVDDGREGVILLGTTSTTSATALLHATGISKSKHRERSLTSVRSFDPHFQRRSIRQ